METEGKFKYSVYFFYTAYLLIAAVTSGKVTINTKGFSLVNAFYFIVMQEPLLPMD